MDSSEKVHYICKVLGISWNNRSLYWKAFLSVCFTVELLALHELALEKYSKSAFGIGADSSQWAMKHCGDCGL